MKADPKKIALVGATLLGGVHFLWAVLVALGSAQALVDFSLWAHMVHLAVVVGPFDALSALTIIVAASLVGYCLGYAAGMLWNRFHD